MSAAVFNTITAADWRIALLRSRSEGNVMLAQIRQAVAQKFSQQGAARGAGRSHKPESAGSTPAPATNLESGGVESSDTQRASLRLDAAGRTQLARSAGVAPGPLSISSHEPKEGSSHAVTTTKSPAHVLTRGAGPCEANLVEDATLSKKATERSVSACESQNATCDANAPQANSFASHGGNSPRGGGDGEAAACAIVGRAGDDAHTLPRVQFRTSNPMGKTYDLAPDEVHDRVKALIARYHSELAEVRIRIDLLMASTDVEDAHAVTLGGYPCYAVVKIVGAKERAKGAENGEIGDAEIVIDRDAYEAMTDAQRDALLDHELYHLEVKHDKRGRPKLDDHGRPMLKMRKHDFNVGWFHAIARRHGQASFEVQQAREFVKEHGQTYLDFPDEARRAMLPTEDSVAREAPAPKSVAETLVNQAAEGQGVAPFVEMAKRDGITMEIRTGDKSVKIDADGVHPQPSDEQVEAATKLAQTHGWVSRAAIQRELNIGFNMASAIADRLVAKNIVGQPNDVGRFELVRATEPAPAAA